jgi:hypothetical protein
MPCCGPRCPTPGSGFPWKSSRTEFTNPTANDGVGIFYTLVVKGKHDYALESVRFIGGPGFPDRSISGQT